MISSKLGLHFAEISSARVSCRSRGEWDKLAKWVVNNKLFSDNVRWLIQIPRLYEVFKASETVESFGDVVTSKRYHFP